MNSHKMDSHSVNKSLLQSGGEFPRGTALVPSAEVHSSRRFAIAVLLMGAFLPPLDFYVVNLALPAIRQGLRTSGSELQLIISSYASAYAVFLITGERIGMDRS
jgi:hypothetical protein